MLGAGGRGTIYAAHALDHPEDMSVFAVIDPRAEWRERLADRHGLAGNARFSSWDAFAASSLSAGAEAVVNATPDRVHAHTAREVLAAGLPMLLEKPIAPTVDDVCDLAARAAAPGSPTVVVGHVLRHTPFYQALRELVGSGSVGRVVHVTHRENLWFNHFAHSFVRGNWGSAAVSSPFILAKCCHDLDLFTWLFDDGFDSVSSTGALGHFRPEHRPTRAPERCTDGCREDCLYDARPLYLHERDHWPANTITPFVAAETAIADRRRALESGPYGRCVYSSDNDVPDHQVATFEMTSGATMTLVISGHHHEETRVTHIEGTLGTISARFGTSPFIELARHGSGTVERLVPELRAGHGGGDAALMADFVKVVTDPAHESDSTLATAVPSHLAALAAEASRISGGASVAVAGCEPR